MLHAILKYIATFSLCRRLVYICEHLPIDLPRYWEHVARFVNLKTFHKNTLTEDQCRLCFDNIISLDTEATKHENQMFRELCDFSNKNDFPLGYVLVSSNNTCRVCNSRLRVKSRGKLTAKVVLYDDVKGTFLASHLTKFCHKENCSFRQYYGKHTLTGHELLFDQDWADNKYFLSTFETGFELSMLRRLDAELLIGQISYQQRSRIYNDFHGYVDNDKKTVRGKVIHQHCQTQQQQSNPNTPSEKLIQDRMRLDRRRLEDAHLQFAMLQVIQYFPKGISLEKICFKDPGKAMKTITPLFHETFTSHYAEHRCNFPGCRRCLVIDGNMKNSREVCKAKDVGFIKYEGLPGTILTGCINAPGFESRYCSEHKDYSCDLKISTSNDVSSVPQEELFSGPITRAMAKLNGNAVQEDGIVEAVLDKKETRSRTYYKIKFLGRSETEATWEPEDAIPPQLLEFFNSKRYSGNPDIVIKTSNYNGQVSQTYCVKAGSKENEEPVVKKAKYSMELPQEGFFANEKITLKCNTEKDKDAVKRKNERTAGILCGLWPCGVFNIFAELFKSESKAQVYAVLHEALRMNQEQFQNLEYVIYDDGCHLKKYAENSKRSQLTDQSKQLSSINIVVDKMHMKGHVDPWCKSHCDSRSIKELEEVDTEVCEQAFSWLSSYKKMTRKMNQEHFIFFILYLLHLHNQREERKLINSGFMSEH